MCTIFQKKPVGGSFPTAKKTSLALQHCILLQKSEQCPCKNNCMDKRGQDKMNIVPAHFSEQCACARSCFLCHSEVMSSKTQRSSGSSPKHSLSSDQRAFMIWAVLPHPRLRIGSLFERGSSWFILLHLGSSWFCALKLATTTMTHQALNHWDFRVFLLDDESPEENLTAL